MKTECPHELARFYVPTDTSGMVEGSRIGASWLDRHGPEWDGEPLVVVPTDKHARSNAHLRRTTTEHRWETADGYQGARSRGWNGGPAVLFYPSSRVLASFDQNPLVPALCVVQGSTYDTTAWAKATSPEDLTTGLPYPLGPELDPVVIEGLRAVQESRHWHQLTTAEDISLTVRTLRLLDAHDHSFVPCELEAWALSECWTFSASVRLSAYADKVLDGRYIPLRAMTIPPRGAVARWRKGAVADGTRAAIAAG